MLARLLLLWLALALASNGWRLLQASPAPASATPVLPVTLDSYAAVDPPAHPPLLVPYRQLGNTGAAPPLLLLSPRPAAVLPLAQAMAREHYVIVPDLRGTLMAHGGAARGAHPADLLLGFIRALEVPTIDLVAHAEAAPVAAAAAMELEATVNSLSLLGPRGIAQLELLGEHSLNQSIRISRAWAVRVLRWVLPHFGTLDSVVPRAAFAHREWQASQRRLPSTLRALEMPSLILIGAGDDRRARARAREYHRLIAHSAQQTLPGVMLADGAKGAEGEVAASLAGFLAAVRASVAAPTASAERQAAAAASFDWAAAPAPEGRQLLLLLALLVVATYVSEDLTCISAGLLVARGTIAFWPATLACLIGIFTGDLALYCLGRLLGRPALERRPLRWLLSAGQLARSEAWFGRRGPWVIILSRFVPGSRVPCYVTAGLLRLPILRFAAYFAIAAILWTPLLVGLAVAVGDRALVWIDGWGAWGLPLSLAALAALYLLIRLISSLTTWRGRRLLYAAIQRKLRWEFWPPWLFYPPLIAYILYLGVRYRGFTAFTAANPAMPAGGFVGESKAKILAGLGSDHPHALPMAIIPEGDASARAAFVSRFASDHELTFPLVLKPDAGERGRDVAIVRDKTAITQYLAYHTQATLVQAYAPGHEFGVFYYRHPGAERGHVLAVTDKRPVSVTGDGERRLEDLILDHPRAIFMAPHFLQVHAARLESVPLAGEAIPLVEVGTHCLGCLFLDGTWVQTPALEEAIDALSKRYEGFFFGRYDIRTPSVEDFREGRNFKVIELNGVTSEATSIYDPDNSLWAAYGVLMRQWRLAFEIGAANRARGVRPSSIGELIALVRPT